MKEDMTVAFSMYPTKLRAVADMGLPHAAQVPWFEPKLRRVGCLFIGWDEKNDKNLFVGISLTRGFLSLQFGFSV